MILGQGIYAFIYCTKWRSGRVSRMPDRLTTLKDRNTQLLIKFKTGALVTQLISDLLNGIFHTGVTYGPLPTSHQFSKLKIRVTMPTIDLFQL